MINEAALICGRSLSPLFKAVKMHVILFFNITRTRQGEGRGGEGKGGEGSGGERRRWEGKGREDSLFCSPYSLTGSCESVREMGER